MWYGCRELSLDFPDGWDVDVCAMPPARELTDREIASAVEGPVAGPPLAELARGRSSCCILVDDMTRPTPAGRVLAPVLGCLERAGLGPGQVFLVVANGAHGALNRDQMVRKLGRRICDRFHVMRHDTHQNLRPVEGAAGMGRILVNEFFLGADLRLAVTGVVPHFMCGFSGGAKIVMPAVCGLESIAATHEHTVDGPPARVGMVEGNRMREIIEECARRAGLHWTANCTFTPNGGPAGVFCGSPRESHRAAVRHARRACATDVRRGADVAVFNAFPKDTEFIQAMAALNVWAERREPAGALVRPGGTIVVITACSEGLGAHELIEHGRRHFVRRDRHGSFRDVLAGRNLLFLAPNVPPATVHRYYPPRTRAFREWAPLRTALRQLHPDGARAAVYPTSALQLDAAHVAGN